VHPILSRPERAWIVYASCGTIGVLLATIPLRQAGAASEEIAWYGAWGALLMFLALQSWHIARFVPITTVSFGRLFGTALLASAVFSGIWVAVGWGSAVALSNFVPTVASAMEDAWVSMWLAGAATYLCMMFLIYALHAADEGEASARRALQSDVASRDAELRALRAQVNPHFLFNCLNSISSMTSRDPEGARRMCLELADFFRSSLKAGAEQRITLAMEVQLLRRYLDIEQVRFGDRLVVDMELSDEASRALVPPLLLQPLAENAVRHGVATLIEGGRVRIAAARAAGRVEITVENPFDPDARHSGTGVGLANVRDRLEAAYRGQASVRADTTLDGEVPVFKVSLSIPVEERESGADA
jgi:hypothetical protein